MPRTKRVWSVRDFAEHLGIPHRQARAVLKRLDAQMSGRLLLPSEGANRQFTFVRAVLARAKPEYFESVASAEEKLEELEERLAEAERRLKMLGSTVGAHSYELATMQQQGRRRARAA